MRGCFSYSTAEKYCDCPPDGSHCTLADLSSGGYGVYEFQTCGEACFVDVMCTRPSTPGYAIETETLNAPSFAVKFKNNACATGYAGSPNAEPCSSAGPYKLSGCTPFKCTRPTTPGYPAPASETLDAPGFKVTYTNNECAAGYAGTPEAKVCASAGPYTVSGCTPMKCGDLPAGKGYKSGKDKAASCGGKCEDMCFETLKCGSVATPAARSSPTASRP